MKRLTIAHLLLVTVAILECAAIAQDRNAANSDSSANWKAVADSFMADLVADRTEGALRKMEPEFIKGVGGEKKAKAAVEQLYTYCGRPLDSEFKHEERGFKQYLTGRRKEMRKFYYASTTNQYKKGVCFFAVEVVPGDGGGYAVTTFGPLKLQSGQLPDWLK
jgi:hypothetical protein